MAGLYSSHLCCWAFVSTFHGYLVKDMMIGVALFSFVLPHHLACGDMWQCRLLWESAPNLVVDCRSPVIVVLMQDSSLSLLID